VIRAFMNSVAATLAILALWPSPAQAASSYSSVLAGVNKWSCRSRARRGSCSTPRSARQASPCDCDIFNGIAKDGVPSVVKKVAIVIVEDELPEPH